MCLDLGQNISVSLSKNFFNGLLGPDWKSLRQQTFQRDNSAAFADYEEFEDLPQQAVYKKPFIEAYLRHCRDKAARVIAAETLQSLNQRPGFERKEFSRAELHVYNIRHIQHHLAQLSLRLRIDAGVDVPAVAT